MVEDIGRDSNITCYIVRKVTPLIVVVEKRSAVAVNIELPFTLGQAGLGVFSKDVPSVGSTDGARVYPCLYSRISLPKRIWQPWRSNTPRRYVAYARQGGDPVVARPK